MELFFKKHNLYATINTSSNSGFKKNTFSELILELEKLDVDTDHLKELYPMWKSINHSEINGYDKFCFFWGYDIERLENREIMTFAEASERWGLSDSTLRMAIKRGTLKEGKDYRKSGKVWLITKEAMQEKYGNEK